MYADQTSYASNSSNNFDCEAILSLNGSIYLFTKNRGDFQTRVYRLPKTPGSYTVSPYTNYNVNGKITGADYNRQKKEVVLIGYMASNKNSFLYFLNDFNGDLFFSGNKRRIEIGNAVNDWQTEGVTYGVNANEIFISCETSYTTASLYNANKSNMIPLSITNQSINSNLLKIYPNPANQFLNVSSDSRLFEVELLNMQNQQVYVKQFDGSVLDFTMTDLDRLSAGVFFLKVKSMSGTYYQKVIIGH